VFVRRERPSSSARGDSYKSRLAIAVVVGSLSDSRLRRTRNGESFGKYGRTVLKCRGKLQSPSDKEKIERLRHEKINADSYTKWTAGRVAATPALQNKPVGPASCTTQGHARCPLEYPHLAVARAYRTRARSPSRPARRRLRKVNDR
jgi:hypothetical protein